MRTDASCYEKKLASGLSNLRRAEQDRAGSFLVGAVSESGQSRVVLLTGTSLVNNRGLAVSGNRILLGHILEYLSPMENDLSIPVKSLSGAAPAPSSFLRSMLVLLAMAAIPALLLYLGVQICYKKKHS